MDQPLKSGFIPIQGGAYHPEFLAEVLDDMVEISKQWLARFR
jgi:hypothetical protein